MSITFLELESEPLVAGDRVLVKWPNGNTEEHTLSGELISLNSEYPDFEYKTYLRTKVKGQSVKLPVNGLLMKRLDGSNRTARWAKLDWSKQ